MTIEKKEVEKRPRRLSRTLQTLSQWNLVDSILVPNTKLVGSPPTRPHRTHRMIPIRNGQMTIRRLPFTSKTKRTDVSRDDGIARQCTPVSDS